MLMDNVQFRKDFPEFESIAKYPNSVLTFWAGVAEKLIRECIWKDMYSTAIQLYVAHNLVIEANDLKASSAGGVPGQSLGAANSKTVGEVSVSYDSTSTAEKDAGWYNLTTYGKRFIRLARLFGAGAIQL